MEKYKLDHASRDKETEERITKIKADSPYARIAIVKVDEEDGEEFFSEIEDDDEYETIADAFIDRLQNAFEIEEQ